MAALTMLRSALDVSGLLPYYRVPLLAMVPSYAMLTLSSHGGATHMSVSKLPRPVVASMRRATVLVHLGLHHHSGAAAAIML